MTLTFAVLRIIGGFGGLERSSASAGAILNTAYSAAIMPGGGHRDMTAAFGLDAVHGLRDEAVVIWKAAVAAVDSARLVGNAVHRTGSRLIVCGHEFDLDRIGRICVVGAGKAGAGMAQGLEEALGGDLRPEKVYGWVNVPADCVRPLRYVHLHAARPAGINEPTTDGVAGSERILSLVSALRPEDLCLVLLSGGASALLPAPAAGVSLEDKQAVTRMLSRAGASIRDLNCVRKQLSRIKGGGLARACRAGTLVTLIISDIVGDPIDVIGSGPTIPDRSTPDEALVVLSRFDPSGAMTPPAVRNWLRKAAEHPAAARDRLPERVIHHVIGNNAMALRAAGDEAHRRGWKVLEVASDQEGIAREVGAALARRCRDLRNLTSTGRLCLLSGGEPVVRLEPSSRPQKGGRNQEVALAAVAESWQTGLAGICILSGGTDGEDGPTDAAGAVADELVIAAARQAGLNPCGYLADHNAYEFFERCGGLLKTGPTHTNVMDVRVALIDCE